MKKKVVAALILITTLSVHLNALAYDFDPNYYARKYPDVVAVIGNDPAALLNHYNTSGITEGRYCCQAEESDYFSRNEVKPKQQVAIPTPEEVKQATQTTKVVETPKQETTTTTTVLPLVVEPKYSTYIDVDIANQVVTYFEDKVVKLQSPCVTGLANGKRDTPTGTYTIKTHETNRYLVGPTWKSYVSYWMRFTDTACGLHDATWRSEFGGSIYKTNGSHGCVNLPKDFAAQLYNAVDIGTIVYVH